MVDSEAICSKCRAGILERYQRVIKRENTEVTILGKICSRCGYIKLDDDDDVWSIVGL